MPLNIYRLTVEKNTTSTIKIATIGIEADKMYKVLMYPIYLFLTYVYAKLLNTINIWKNRKNYHIHITHLPC